MQSNKIFPTASVADITDLRDGDVECFCQSCLVSTFHTLSLTNLLYLALRKFRSTICEPRTTRCVSVSVSPPIFCDAVINVISRCSKKQMVRIYTFGIVAMMAYQNIIRWISKSMFESQPVNHDRDTIFFDLAITAAGQGTLPLPATIGSITVDSCPQTLPKCLSEFFGSRQSSFCSHAKIIHQQTASSTP